jgi:hypothetical protein
MARLWLVLRAYDVLYLPVPATVILAQREWLLEPSLICSAGWLRYVTGGPPHD